MITIIIQYMNSSTLPLGKTASQTPRLRLELRSLMQGRQEIEICHQGEVYRLRLTRNGKLILTK